MKKHEINSDKFFTLMNSKICYNSDVYCHYYGRLNIMKYLKFIQLMHSKFSIFSSNFKRCAFTLAEVLVTIGILGVVAALTIPALTGGTKPKELQAQFKEAHALLSQVVMQVVDEKGIGLKKIYATPGSNYPNAPEIQSAIYNKLNIVGECVYKGNVTNYSKTSDSVFIDRGNAKPDKLLANGMCFNVYVNAGAINLSIDINGAGKRPNALGHDIFFFEIASDDTLYPKKMVKLLSDEELKDEQKFDASADYPNYSSQSGDPCSAKSKQLGNGLGCAYFALINQNPDDSSKTYWDNLPK